MLKKCLLAFLSEATVIAALLFVPCMTVYGQISMPKQKMTLEEVAKRIGTQSSYKFFYNDEISSEIIYVSKIENKPIVQALDEIFKDSGISYRLNGKVIYLTKKSEPKTTSPVSQKKKVTGKVTDANGAPLIGVSIKASNTGTITDLDGNYNIEVNDGEKLQFSYLGFIPKSADAHKDVLNIVLTEDKEQLSAVVVTALGIKRSEKALSYNVQQVNSEKLTSVKDANFVNSLAGKVAGVTINAGAAGAGGAVRVIMRGMKSIEKNNTVLYVIDGIPMYNKSFGGTGGVMSKAVGSESAADINPEDIESVNMLTGPSAAALYGSDAANGVIIINTKKGASGTTKVTVSNSTTFSRVYMMPQMQNRYGRSNGYSSWGRRLDASYNYEPSKFFNTGTNIINSVSLSTGTSKNQTYISATTTNTRGIMPGSSYDRYNFTARNTAKFAGDRLTLDFGVSFISQNDKNFVSQGSYFNPLPSLYLFPRGEDFNEVRLFERWNPVTGIMTQYWPYSEGSHNMQNPYWIQERNIRYNTKHRYMLNSSLKYDIADWINIAGRVRLDEADYKSISKFYATTLTTFAGINGGYGLDKMSDRNFYGDIILNINKTWGNWSIVANIGSSINDQVYDMSRAAGDLIIPNHFALNNLNTATAYKGNQDGWHDQTQSVFASIEGSYKNMLYLTVTGRNDWASQLAYTSRTSFFYPSVGISAVISEMFKMPDLFPYLKIRGAFSQVASPFDRFLSNPSYQYNEQTHNWSKSDIYPAHDLKSEDTKSWEIGVSTKFLHGFSLDVTYYKSNTYNQTIYAPLSASAGYKKFVAQTGNIQNSGLELALSYDHTWGDFNWNSSLTYTFNRNIIKELAHGIPDPVTGEPVNVEEIEKDWLGASNVAPQVILKEGGSMTDVYVNHLIARDLNGHVAVDNNGNIKLTQVKPFKVGQLSPKGNIGWNNSFSYKGLSLSALVTARLGGVVYSATQGILDYYGVSKVTADMRDNPGGGIPVNYGTLSAEKYYTTISTAQGGHGAFYIYDATNVRLSELSVNYTIPKKLFAEKCKLTLGFVARNLAMIYCKAPFDPELSAATANNYYQGVDYFMAPSTRNMGFNVKLQF